MKNTSAMNWDVAGECAEYLSGSDMPLDHADGALGQNLSGPWCTLRPASTGDEPEDLKFN